MDANINPAAVAEAIAEMRHTELENAARAVIGAREYFTSKDLEELTGTKASTWRYWASKGVGPASFSLGRRRVWKRASAFAWLAEQEQGTAS